MGNNYPEFSSLLYGISLLFSGGFIGTIIGIGANDIQVQQQGIKFPLPPISGDSFSTTRIVARMCTPGIINDTSAREFWNCYNVTEGIELFEECQLQIFSLTLSTEENFKIVCNSMDLFPYYAGCLYQGFEEAGIDLGFTLDLVNKCEAVVLGIKPISYLLSLIEE